MSLIAIGRPSERWDIYDFSGQAFADLSSLCRISVSKGNHIVSSAVDHVTGTDEYEIHRGDDAIARGLDGKHGRRYGSDITKESREPHDALRR